jgi:hypothetical protein
LANMLQSIFSQPSANVGAVPVSFVNLCAGPYCPSWLRPQVEPMRTGRARITSPFESALFKCTYVPWYIGNIMDESKFLIERVQTGVRMEKRLLKVLKGFAEYHDMSLGDLLEGIVLHAFDGKTPFSAESLKRIQDLKKFYALDLDSSASHRLTEIKQRSRNKTASEKKK